MNVIFPPRRRRDSHAALWIAWIALLLPALLPNKSFAQSERITRFYWENDIGDGDKFYTNGLRFSSSVNADTTWLRRVETVWFWKNTLGLLGPVCGRSVWANCRSLRTGVAFGQNFYTPVDISLSTPPVGDRPYAGWLYVGRSFQFAGLDAVQSLEFDAGVVGPLALGESVQKGWHQLISDEDWPSGWDHQVPFEPGVNAVYRGQIRLLEVANALSGLAVVSPLSSESKKTEQRQRFFDLTPRWGLTLGTVTRDVSAGGAVRLGWNVSSDYIDRITPVAALETNQCECKNYDSVPPPAVAPQLTSEKRSSLIEKLLPDEAYGFLAYDGIYRAHSVFLDGAQIFFPDGPSVERKPGISDRELGGVVRWGKNVVALRRVSRSAEFEGGISQKFWAFSYTQDRRSRRE